MLNISRLLLLAVLLGVQAQAQAQTPTEEPAVQTSQQYAAMILMEMAEFLAGLDKFSVSVRSGYDAVQENGQKVEFLEHRDLTVARPDHLRADETGADGRNSMVLFDGSQITVWDADRQVFAQADQPGGVDDSIVYFTRELGMRLPLAALAMQRLPQELARRAIAVDYVELTAAPLFPVDAHHIVMRTEAADVQLWIADDSDRPWPLRMVLSYVDDPGQPQHWGDFSDWTTRPKISKSTFRFKPPADAEQIVFSVQIPAPDQTFSGQASQQGDQQ